MESYNTRLPFQHKTHGSIRALPNLTTPKTMPSARFQCSHAISFMTRTTVTQAWVEEDNKQALRKKGFDKLSLGTDYAEKRTDDFPAIPWLCLGLSDGRVTNCSVHPNDYKLQTQWLFLWEKNPTVFMLNTFLGRWKDYLDYRVQGANRKSITNKDRKQY